VIKHSGSTSGNDGEVSGKNFHGNSERLVGEKTPQETGNKQPEQHYI
jgi:hypothetical protein